MINEVGRLNLNVFQHVDTRKDGTYLMLGKEINKLHWVPRSTSFRVSGATMWAYFGDERLHGWGNERVLYSVDHHLNQTNRRHA